VCLDVLLLIEMLEKLMNEYKWLCSPVQNLIDMMISAEWPYLINMTISD
jgi:hypothetical protein